MNREESTTSILNKKLHGVQKRSPLYFQFTVIKSLGKVYITLPEISDDLKYEYTYTEGMDIKAFISQIVAQLRLHYPRCIIEGHECYLDKVDYRENCFLLRRPDGSLFGLYRMFSPVAYLLKRIKISSPKNAGRILTEDIREIVNYTEKSRTDDV